MNNDEYEINLLENIKNLEYSKQNGKIFDYEILDDRICVKPKTPVSPII